MSPETIFFKWLNLFGATMYCRPAVEDLEFLMDLTETCMGLCLTSYNRVRIVTRLAVGYLEV